MNKMSLLLSFLALAVSCTDAFQIATSISTPHGSERVPTTTRLGTTISLDRETPREVAYFQDWAAQCGVQTDNGFCLADSLVDGNEDWFAVTSTGGAQNSPVLYVPDGMIFSAARIAQEYEGYVEKSFEVLERKGGLQHLYPQFYLFIKVLMEYEQGADSPYYPWFAAMPRKWNTAVAMDDFCLSVLPPFIKSLCRKERSQLASFREALKAFEYLSPESKANDTLMRFAYNLVVTRSFPTGEDLQIIPMADMLNHGYPANAALYSDPEAGGCQVILTEDVAPGTPLTLSYGEPTNPSRFLATYGFLNEAPATYCKLLFSNPSQELINIGYDPERLLFYTEDGGIAPEVWDVLLYSRLELKPDLNHVKEAFYEAHMNGDEETKAAIQGQYIGETSNALLRHVINILTEVFELTVKMNAFDASYHPRLPLLKQHNEMVTSTFQKVRANLEASG